MIAGMLRTASLVPRLLPRVLVALLLSLAGAGRAAAEPPAANFDALATTVRKAVDSDKPEDALRAYARIGPLLDPRAVDLVIETAPKIVARRDAIVKEQTDAATTLENALAKIEKANATTPITPRDIADYNKRTRKLEADRDAATAKLRDLGLDIAQWKAVLAAASAAVGLVIETLPRPEGRGGAREAHGRVVRPEGPARGQDPLARRGVGDQDPSRRAAAARDLDGRGRGRPRARRRALGPRRAGRRRRRRRHGRAAGLEGLAAGRRGHRGPAPAPLQGGDRAADRVPRARGHRAPALGRPPRAAVADGPEARPVPAALEGLVGGRQADVRPAGEARGRRRPRAAREGR